MKPDEIAVDILSSEAEVSTDLDGLTILLNRC